MRTLLGFVRHLVTSSDDLASRQTLYRNQAEVAEKRRKHLAGYMWDRSADVAFLCKDPPCNQRLALSICSACLRLVSVTVAPEIMRAISPVRSSSFICRI